MKTLEELGGYYNAVLMPELRVIEEKRKKVLKKVFLWGGSICGLFCLILVGLILLGLGFQFIIFAVVGLAAALGLTFRLLTANYTGEFKTKIIKKIVSFIDEGLSYSKDGCIPRADFILSKIFHRRPDRYRGDDYVSGMIDKTKLRFSEVYAEYETRDSKGNRHWHKLFKGLFFICNNRHFAPAKPEINRPLHFPRGYGSTFCLNRIRRYDNSHVGKHSHERDLFKRLVRSSIRPH